MHEANSVVYNVVYNSIIIHSMNPINMNRHSVSSIKRDFQIKIRIRGEMQKDRLSTHPSFHPTTKDIFKLLNIYIFLISCDCRWKWKKLKNGLKIIYSLGISNRRICIWIVAIVCPSLLLFFEWQKHQSQKEAFGNCWTNFLIQFLKIIQSHANAIYISYRKQFCLMFFL